MVRCVVKEGRRRLGEERRRAEASVLLGKDNLVEEPDEGGSGSSDLTLVYEFIES